MIWLSDDLKGLEISQGDMEKLWGVRRVSYPLLESANYRSLGIPAQSGRAALSFDTFGRQGDILIKGSGLNPERVSEVGKIRYDHVTGQVKPMDGNFLVREALLDQMTTEILMGYGVRAAKPLAIISFENDQDSSEALKGVYVREFLNQTRLSNLSLLDDNSLAEEFKRAAKAIQRVHQTNQPMNLEQHFFYLMDEMAKMVAVFHYLGFEHRFFYSQQVTLAGEITDLGTGSWLYDDSKFSNLNSNVEIPYLSFDNQVLLGLNMLMRTHALKTDSPGRLSQESETLRTQKKSLLAAIRRIDPAVEESIHQKNPELVFWRSFTHHLSELYAREAPPVLLRHRLSENFDEWLSKSKKILGEKQMLELEARRDDFEVLKKRLALRFLPDSSLLQLLENMPDHWRQREQSETWLECLSQVRGLSRTATR